MTRYWIGVASEEHVQKGVQASFAQVCHGKLAPLNQMKKGDWLIYYSPTFTFGGTDRCQSFTAIGTISTQDPYPVQMTPDWTPWRHNVKYVEAKNVSIHPLLENLSFIRNKQKWGFPFRRGAFSIPEEDFYLIAQAMEARL